MKWKKEIERKAKIIGDISTSVPRIYLNFLLKGIAPLPASVLKIALQEGTANLQKKAIGDFLVRFFSSSGPVLTKIGQILATRDDLVSAEVAGRLKALYRDNAPMPLANIRKILSTIEQSDSLLESIERAPIGVGSIGQVHRAKLGNEEVIVKMVRPGVLKSVRRDFVALKGLLSVLRKIYKKRDVEFSIAEKSIESLERSFILECDLTNEAKNMEEFRVRFKKNTSIYIPKLYMQYSTSDLLVMEEIKGVPLDEYVGKSDSSVVAEKYLRELLTQIFDEGFFHGDPHMGNVIVLKDGRLGLIDLGLVGEFESNERKYIAGAIKAFISRDVDGVISSFLNFGHKPKNWDYEGFKRDIISIVKTSKAEITNGITGKSGDESGLEEFVNGLFKIAYKHGLYLPHSTVLLIKTMVTIEGVARTLDSEINLVKVALPVVLRSMTPKWLRFFSAK